MKYKCILEINNFPFVKGKVYDADNQSKLGLIWIYVEGQREVCIFKDTLLKHFEPFLHSFE